MTESDKKAFREMVPVSSFPPEKFEELCGMCRVDSGAPGTLLFQQSERNNSFYFLLTGKVSFAIGDIPIETVAAGSPSARFALAHQFPRKVTATALTTIRYIRLDNGLLEAGNPDRQSAGGDAPGQASGSQPIAALLLSDRQPSQASHSETRNNQRSPSAFGRFFGWVKRASVRPSATEPARMAPSAPAETQIDAACQNFGIPHSIEPSRPAIPVPGLPTSPQNSEHAVTHESGWKRGLPRDIENQLQALLIPLMRNVSDISGGLVTTDRGSFLSSEFPKHRVERIQAIVRAATSADHPETRDYPDEAPEEILLRESNSLMLIFLIGTHGLLALNADSSANLGLIRLEAHPVVTRVGDIIAGEAESRPGS
ncbi:MAG: hypothetical protein L0Y38_09480 [Methylococcaceae bacterium]|nr:hypothetical protein [Methylococcaceae bacterium]MCI0734036.1 hypothetical protein [Methylococcaceae bacterium]